MKNALRRQSAIRLQRITRGRQLRQKRKLTRKNIGKRETIYTPHKKCYRDLTWKEKLEIIRRFYELTKQLKDDDFWIVGLENGLNSQLWNEINYSGKIAIIVGSEGSGIRKKVLENCDFTASIPMQGFTNSLNVSAAVSAILFERLRQIQSL